MRKIVNEKRELCTGCNRCVRECPMEMTNITYQDEDGNIKVYIDHSKCIACGRCVSACKHDARYFEDDTARFLQDLASGIPISVIAAPSIQTNIPDWKRLFTYLKQLGAQRIYDASLGADICIWAHIRHMAQSDYAPLITQPCPSIVSYCKIYRHDLLAKLSPIHSPIGCTAVLMKEYDGVTDRIAVLTPCIAKADEFEDTGLAQYNITFSKLLAHLKEHAIALPAEETAFDHGRGGIGSLFPMPGGLKENMEFYLGKRLHISRSEGFHVYDELNAYAETPRELLPDVFDVLNCDKGCNIGSACAHTQSIFAIDRVMDDNRKAATDHHKKGYFKEVHSAYDDAFDLSHFMREYRPIYTKFPQITNEDIQAAFALLGKDEDVKQHVDCSACGSDTCYKMARKIALKVNIPINCIVKTMETAKEEHALSLNSLEQFETIWSHVESAIVIIDAETRRVMAVNPAAVRMYGQAKEKMIGKPCTELFCTSANCPILDQGQKVDRLERPFTKANGEIISTVKSVSKIRYNGRPALLESFADISYLKEAEERKRLLEVTEQANRAKSAFLANMSHEIRTPMNAIIGMTSIAESAHSVERKDYAIGKIKDASTHLLGVINDILDMSKIEAGKFELSPTAFRFEETLKRVVAVNDYRVIEKRQRLSLHIDAAIPPVLCGDEQRLAQVITNLLSNAVKFTPEKGSIDICARFLGEENGVCQVQIDVSDTGIGISPEQQARLFQSFHQAESSTSRKYGGTGLGLVISKSIVELMGGHIWIESELGKGATFSFTIAAGRIDEAAYAANARKAGDRPAQAAFYDWFGEYRILLAEDVEINREIVLALLETTMIAIDCAENGSEAVRMFREAPDRYDMIFMDLQMPEMDGYEATRCIRALDMPKAKVIPIIAMTANVFREDVEKCLAAGMDGHIGKPLNFAEVLQALRQHLPQDGRQMGDRRKLPDRRRTPDRRQTPDRRKGDRRRGD